MLKMPNWWLVATLISKLLSNDDIAKVSSAEAASGRTEGGEYLDLEHLGDGCSARQGRAKVTMGHALPRSAVSGETWRKILAQLARRSALRSNEPG